MFNNVYDDILIYNVIIIKFIYVCCIIFLCKKKMGWIVFICKFICYYLLVNVIIISLMRLSRGEFM